VPELDTSVFLVPGDKVKNTEERLVVLNRIARSVIDSVRGMHPEYVFVHKPIRLRAHDREAGVELKPIERMNNTAWRNARERAADKWEEQTGQPAPMGFRRVRVHDMKHTFGRRLRAAGVSFEDRQDLLGHKNGRITTHYSSAELANLIAAAERVCDENSRKSPASTWLRRRAG
jgi:integrase